MAHSKSPVDVILGTGSFGYRTSAGITCVSDKAVVQSIINEFKKRGYHELDNARSYSEGTSEELFAELDYEAQGLKMDTKIWSFAPGSHTTANLNKSLNESLAALKTKKIHTLFLHGPDRATPFEETLAAINEAYKQGSFEKFGLSNCTAEEVEKYLEIAEAKGSIKPSVYQGLYNVLARKNEEKLFPLLRKHGISFFAYSPLAGSFLIGNTPRAKEDSAPGTRFDPNIMAGALYRNYFCKDSLFDGVELIREAGKKHGISVSDIALRWLVNHSQLSRKHGDAIITGGTKLANFQATLESTERGPLPADVLKVVEDVWVKVKSDAPAYHI